MGTLLATGHSQKALKSRRGYCAHRAGLAAEAQVAAQYQLLGYSLVAERWRGRSGELDLIFKQGDGFVVVEVKKAKSVETALRRLTQRQLQRIMLAAEEFAGAQPLGALTPLRIDLAAVGGLGDVSILENISL